MNEILKKLPLLCLLLLLGLPAWAEEDEDEYGYEYEYEYPADGEDSSEISSWEDDQVVPRKKEFRVKNRRFEIAVGAGFALSNDFIAYNDVFLSPFTIIKNLWGFWNWKEFPNDQNLFFNDPIQIDLDDLLTKGLKVDFGVSANPSISYNHKDKWGFGLDLLHVNVTGNISLPGNLLVLYENKTAKFGGAAFVDVGIPVFFHIDEFKVKIRPAAYVTAAYTKPRITYRYVDNGLTMYLEAAYNMKVYTLFDFSDGFDPEKLMNSAADIPRNNMGYDLGIGVEYPLYSWLDLGVDVKNLPIMGSKLNYFVSMKQKIYFDSSELDIEDIIINGLPEDKEVFKVSDLVTEYGSEEKKIYRPFSMLFYATYRPFDWRIISFTPSLGFSVNALYPEKAAMEGGLYATLDLGNIFAVTYGLNYNDRKWKSSFDFILFNCRLFEVDLGISTQSPELKKAFAGAGLGVNVGVKLGW